MVEFSPICTNKALLWSAVRLCTYQDSVFGLDFLHVLHVIRKSDVEFNARTGSLQFNCSINADTNLS